MEARRRAHGSDARRVLDSACGIWVFVVEGFNKARRYRAAKDFACAPGPRQSTTRAAPKKSKSSWGDAKPVRALTPQAGRQPIGTRIASLWIW